MLALRRCDWNDCQDAGTPTTACDRAGDVPCPSSLPSRDDRRRVRVLGLSASVATSLNRSDADSPRASVGRAGGDSDEDDPRKSLLLVWLDRVWFDAYESPRVIPGRAEMRRDGDGSGTYLCPCQLSSARPSQILTKRRQSPRPWHDHSHDLSAGPQSARAYIPNGMPRAGRHGPRHYATQSSASCWAAARQPES